jgi:hypothetical protein
MAFFTGLHVVLSLVGIASGAIVVYGWLTTRRLDTWTSVFLVTTVLTSATGFGFPVDHLLPSHIVGLLSLLVLAVAIFARYGRQLAGGWATAFVVSATVALYFNVFVFVAQAFMKVPMLHEAAPTQSEPPFLVAQLVVLVVFVAIGAMATIHTKGRRGMATW